MQIFMMRIGLLAAALALSATAAQAANISGTISSTKTIKENSQLTGDVRCTLTGAPCIQFGVGGITLNLNGFTMTGNGGVNSCTLSVNEEAIDTEGFDNVSILGPGIVKQFQGTAIMVRSDATSVQQVVVLSSCANGIEVQGAYNNIYANTVDRSNLGVSGGLAGIFIYEGEANLITKNEVAGATYAIGVSPISNNNDIEQNNASGVYSDSWGINIGRPAAGNQVLYNQETAPVTSEITIPQARTTLPTISAPHPMSAEQISARLTASWAIKSQTERDLV